MSDEHVEQFRTATSEEGRMQAIEKYVQASDLPIVTRTYFAGKCASCLKCAYGEPKVITRWMAPLEQFFAISPENTDFLKKLFNPKIISIKFVIKKGYINFWCKMTPSPKKRIKFVIKKVILIFGVR